MPKDSLGVKTCCGKLTWSEEQSCWLNQHGGQVRKGKSFYCPDCGRKLKPNGKFKKMVESEEPEE